MIAGHFSATSFRTYVVCGVLAVLVAGSPAFAATSNLNPVKDATIYGDASSGKEENSCGGGRGIIAGQTKDAYPRRALIKFDIAGNIPAGATIDSVSLTMRIDETKDNQSATCIGKIKALHSEVDFY